MRKLLPSLPFAILLVVLTALFAGLSVAQGPLTTAMNLMVRTDSNGALYVYGVAAGAQGPLTNLGNVNLRTYAPGSLAVTVAGGTVTPDSVCVSGTTQDSYLAEVGANNPGMYTGGTSCAGGTLRFDWNATRINFAKPIYLPDGTAAAPSLTLANGTGNGLYNVSASQWGLSAVGGNLLEFRAGDIRINAATSLEWNNDLFIYRDAANTLAQRNGMAGQLFRLYNTFTDASNYERLGINWAANVLTIGPEAAGSGTLRSISYSLALSQAEPVDQTARSSSGGTFVMMGLGAAAAPCTITPTSTGRVYFVITGDIVNNTTATTVSIKMAENTGSAPANNAAATGTVISRTLVTNAVTSVLTTPFTLTATKTGLALNTAVWFDLQLTTSGANTGQPTNIDCTAHEI